MINDYTNRLKLILQRNNVSVADFCRIIGLNSTGTIHKLISDNRKPSSKTVDRIIAAFPEVTKDWLLYGRGSYEVTPNKQATEDDLTVTASQVIKFMNEQVPKHIDQRDNQAAALILERLNDMDNKFQNITEQWDDNYNNYVDKFNDFKQLFNDITTDMLTDIVERITELERYALLTLDERSKERAKKDKRKNNLK